MGIFGWSLPPGCTQRHIDEAYGTEGPCECCGNNVDNCVCDECPICTEQGNPRCYGAKPIGKGDAIGPNGPHGLKYNREQLMGQQRMRIANMEDRVNDEKMYLDYLETMDEAKLPEFINTD